MAFLDFLPIVGGALSTLWNSTVGQSQSKDLMRFQYQLNQQAVDAQNRYNSPIAQMQRLREAGLNPNLVYGNGVDGNQSSAPNVGIANRGNTADFAFNEAVNNVFRRRQLENETGIANANREKLLADSLLSKARYLDVMQDVSRKDATFGIFVEQAAADLEKTREQIANIGASTSKMQQESNNLRIVANNLVLESEQIAAKTQLTQEQVLTEITKRALMHSNISLNHVREAELGEMIKFIAEGTKLRKLGNRIQNTAYDAAKIYQEWKKEHPKTTLTIDIVKEILGMGKDLSEIGKNFIP